jgi:hypothetical protein
LTQRAPSPEGWPRRSIGWFEPSPGQVALGRRDNQRRQAEASREVVEGHPALSFDALLEPVVAWLAAADPVPAIPEHRLVTSVRVEVVGQRGCCDLADELAVSAERMAAQVSG